MKDKTLGWIAGIVFCVFFFFWSEAMKVFGGYFYEYRPDLSQTIPPTILQTHYGNDFIINLVTGSVFGLLFIAILIYYYAREVETVG